jgi:hypothetical protein
MPLIKCFGTKAVLLLTLIPTIIILLANYLYINMFQGPLYLAAIGQMIALLGLMYFMDSYSDRIARCKKSFLLHSRDKTFCRK